MAITVDFNGRVVLVTGGARGVGRGITARFGAAGATVVICGRHEPDALPPGAARFLAADVRDGDQLDALFAAVDAAFGRLDVVVNNAGGAPFVMASEASDRFVRAIVDLNLVAPLAVARRANARMQAQDGGGVILNIASVSGTRPSPGTAAYGAAKAGLLNATRSLAVEWAPKVRVNAIVAGMVRTEQSHLHYGDEAGVAAVAATVPLGRLATPDDIGDACVFLASARGAYASGAALRLDGGGERPAFLDAATTD